MAKAGYTVSTNGAVALSAATAKSILGVNGTADLGIDLKKYRVAFDGVTASAVPVLVELCYSTFATNAPGTNSTAQTPAQGYGRAAAVWANAAASNWTAEPTVLTVIEHYLLTPNGGTVLYDYPLGDTPDSAYSQGFVIRCTAPATVNVRATMWFERS